MASSIGIKFTLTNLDPLCKKLKYSLTVNSVLAGPDTNVIVDRPFDDVLHITKYNTTHNFANSDTISLSIRQGTSFTPNPTTGETTYSSPATLGFTISYSVPAAPAAPSISAGDVSLLNSTGSLNLEVDFTVTGIDTTATRLYYYYTVVPAGGPFMGQTLTFNPFPPTNGVVITTGGADRHIIIDRLDPNKDLGGSNNLYKGDVVTIYTKAGVPLGDNTWEFSATYGSDSVTLDIPAPTDTPATPTGSGIAYGIVT